MKRVALLSLLPLLCSGCFLQRTQFQQPIDAERVAQLVPGQSTAAEVVELLGAPNEVVQLGRRSAYRYQHDQEKVAGLFLIIIAFNNRDTQVDRTWVFFDENDTLTHVGSTLEAEDTEYAMPWVERD